MTKRNRKAPLLLLLAAAFFAGGCVERKLTIRSVPTGARVRLDAEDLGETPATVRFEHYGGRDVTLSTPGYYRLHETFRVKPPYYQRFGLDYFFEHLWPWTLEDHQTFTFHLVRIKELETPDRIDTAPIEERQQEMLDRIEAYKEQREE